MDLIGSLSTEVANKALDGLAKRHTAIASNLANADTPGYRRKAVSFENALSQAVQAQGGPGANLAGGDELPMRVSHPQHLSANPLILSLDDVQPDITEVEGMTYRNDGNGVDVEHEMAQLARNTERYVGLTNLEGRMLRSIRGVINNSGGV